MSSNNANNGWAYAARPRSTDTSGANANGGAGGDGGGGDGKKAELPKYAKESDRVMLVYLVDTSVGALDTESMVQGTRENIKKSYAALANNMRDEFGGGYSRRPICTKRRLCYVTSAR